MDGHGPEVDAAVAEKAAGRPGVEIPPGGGTCYGGAFIDSQPGWIRDPAGWWYHPGEETLPDHLIRGSLNPALVRWEVIQGASEGQRWMVPVLLTRLDGTGMQGSDPLWVPAIDRIRRCGHWEIPADLADLCAEAIQVVHDIGMAGDTDSLAEDRVLAFVARVLGMAYHVSRTELEAHGWISQRLVMRVLTTVVELEPHQ
jgi:hypothetical protein